jgi:hypothetical protein
VKKLVYLGAVFLALIFLTPVAFAKENHGKLNSPHITHSSAHPINARRFQDVSHHFEIHVQKPALRALSIDIPEGIEIGRGIEVKDGSGQKIEAKVAIDKSKATIAFSQSIPPETKLSINMKGINTLRGSTGWDYMIYGSLEGIDREIPLGTVQIQPNR